MIANMTADRRELVELVRRFVTKRAPLADTRHPADSGWNNAIWNQMGTELGLQALAIPEEYGGLGLGLVELALVMEELGAELYNGPYLSSICLAAPIILATATPAQLTELLPQLANGRRTAALAYAEPNGPWDGATANTQWHSTDGAILLSGTKTLVVDGSTADWLIVTAAAAGSDGHELSLLLVDASAAGLTRRRLPAFDQTRALSEVLFQQVPAALLGTPGSASPHLQRTLHQAGVLLAAEQVGAAQHCLDTAVTYARDRMQFARAIGSFQAVKHRCADTLLEIETSRSAVLYALAALESDSNVQEAASLARAHCSETFVRAASANIQIHGGIGFTWEHEAHLYLKRATASSALFGSPDEHRELLAQAIGL